MMYAGDSLALLPDAIERFTRMQNSSDAVTEAGMTMAYRVAPGESPVAVVHVFYNVSIGQAAGTGMVADVAFMLYRGRILQRGSLLRLGISQATTRRWGFIP